MATPSAPTRLRMAAVAATEERLRAAGYAARFITDACPVQLEGRIPTGEAFYLHCAEVVAASLRTPKASVKKPYQVRPEPEIAAVPTLPLPAEEPGDRHS